MPRYLVRIDRQFIEKPKEKKVACGGGEVRTVLGSCRLGVHIKGWTWKCAAGCSSLTVAIVCLAAEV